MALALTAKPAAVGILALTPQAASAANVTVACASGGPGLKAAIASANTSGGTVTLTSGCTYTIFNPST
ncbi:MAG TPA: hypothetical protein VGR61_05875, partial [Candidatus Dormibacteraeota bacterium]|nr:hypothetical protein [Candidatus Dormibacteraeota bacterium]